MRPEPTAGSRDRKAITTDHRITPWMPSAQRMIPPSTPCTIATATLPFTVAFTTAENLPSRWFFGSSSSGMAR